MLRGITGCGIHSDSWVGFFLFKLVHTACFCLGHGKLAELADQVVKMVEHYRCSQPNPTIQVDAPPCSLSSVFNPLLCNGPLHPCANSKSFMWDLDWRLISLWISPLSIVGIPYLELKWQTVSRESRLPSLCGRFSLSWPESQETVSTFHFLLGGACCYVCAFFLLALEPQLINNSLNIHQTLWQITWQQYQFWLKPNEKAYPRHLPP